MEKIVITVVGKDSVGILAKVSNICAGNDFNIIDVRQAVLEGFFTMIMIVEDDGKIDNKKLKEKLISDLSNMEISVVHENIFNSMHRI
ncbi:MAG: ACT domain-containing protein [Clostridiales Family XIII bacterium]|jgi:ACT domain-containing protein|nr:ACT domain-containing protein [Clostridiales Family XIII bacterium]